MKDVVHGMRAQCKRYMRVKGVAWVRSGVLRVCMFGEFVWCGAGDGG